MIDLMLTCTRLSGEYLPINYSYALASWIYKVIGHSDERYSQFLHQEGFQVAGRRFKLFTFSQLDLRPYIIEGMHVKLRGPVIRFTLRFLADVSLQHFIKGLFMNQTFTLYDHRYEVAFEVSGVEAKSPPLFRHTMRYQCLSPICVSRLRSDGTTEYVHPSDESYGKLLTKNLYRKAAAFQLANLQGEEVAVKFRLLNTPRKKGIHIKEGTENHTQVVGYLFHFELDAETELHEVGFYAGFGEKNSMGFGCVDILKDKSK
jgi:CRISPR-associated endoribonuclease Cas6